MADRAKFALSLCEPDGSCHPGCRDYYGKHLAFLVVASAGRYQQSY